MINSGFDKEKNKVIEEGYADCSYKPYISNQT
jgi:hypothetical protein